MEQETANRVYADPLARWFVTEAYRITDTGQLIAQAGEQLVRSGIPLYRLAYFQGTLHPEFAGNGYFWRRDRGVAGEDDPGGDVVLVAQEVEPLEPASLLGGGPVVQLRRA